MATIGLNSAQIRDRAREMGINLSESEVQTVLREAWDQSQYGADAGAVASILGSLKGGGGSSGSGFTSADQFMQSLKDTLSAQMDEFSKRVKDFDTNNPFAFDEALARSSAEQRYNPYYEAELADFTAGIDSQRQSTEGQKTLLTELNRIDVKADNRNLEEAIRASEEGYAGAGLFFSGARERGTGLEKIKGDENAQARDARFNTGIADYDRRLTDINREEQTGIRRTQAQKTTDIESEIARQKAEERSRYEYEKAQYVGYPYITSQTGGLNELLKSSFQY